MMPEQLTGMVESFFTQVPAMAPADAQFFADKYRKNPLFN
jgi:hypothetical protein